MLYFLLIAQSFLISGNPTAWQNDFASAKQLATQEEKHILMVFSGSDWCAPCIKLKKKILLTDEFQAFENENLVVLYLDFPKRKKNRLPKELTKQNEALAEQYNRSGLFPNVLLMDEQGKVVKHIKYTGQPSSDFINEIKINL